MEYRVNYGNGQVSETFTSKRAALQHVVQCRARDEAYTGYYYVEFYVPGSADEPGDWFPYFRTGTNND